MSSSALAGSIPYDANGHTVAAYSDGAGNAVGVTPTTPMPINPQPTSTSGVTVASPVAGGDGTQTFKATGAIAYQIEAYNKSASTQYLMTFNGGSTCTTGATSYTAPVGVPTVSTASLDFGVWGRAYPNGLVVALSSTDGTLTIGTLGFFSGAYL